MDIIRITMNGYGCEVNRGIVPEGKEEKLKESLNNVWFKNLFKKLEEKTKIKKIVEEKGLIKGDIRIEVNGVVEIEMPIRAFETIVKNKKQNVKYPKTKDVVITSIQHQEGLFSDTIFILKDSFKLNKLKLIKKDIKDKADNTIVSSLFCEIHYDNEVIPMMDTFTDLRMSRLYLEKGKML